MNFLPTKYAKREHGSFSHILTLNIVFRHLPVLIALHHFQLNRLPPTS
jgi:hypothetical protein